MMDMNKPEAPVAAPRRNAWPELAFEDGKDTCATLHMWTQIVGKIRMSFSPWVNHSWHVPLYVSARGLTTSLIAARPQSFQIDFDFTEHRLVIETTAGDTRVLPLLACSVADFYSQLMQALSDVGIDAKINTMPCEISDPIPFDQDWVHHSYDAQYVRRFWQALVESSRVFNQFRAAYIGKCSPVHFFWGSFDLALTRFSGRAAPPHPGGVPHLPDWVAREAYSHEVSSCGFWPGSEALPEPAFYAYAYPEPDGYPAVMLPAGAYYHPALRECILPYQELRQAQAPDALLLDFLQASYAAVADLAAWERDKLERRPQ
jgi:hypothetical protein